MKRIMVLLGLAIGLSSCLVAQRGKLIERGAKLAKGVLKAWEFYDKYAESGSPNRYVNPSGTWRSSSGGVFYVSATQSGFAYQNTHGGQFTARASNYQNFYFADFYQNGRFAYRLYYTVTGRNSMTVKYSTGGTFYWTRIR